jgi:sulfur carrier protein
MNLRGIAIALNGEVVPRTEWDDRMLTDGDAVELLVAVQGG